MFLASECDLEGRTTYAFVNSDAGQFVGVEEVALMTKVLITDDRHAPTEVGYLLTVLGGWVGAIVGRDSAGTQFAVVMQRAPLDDADELLLMAQRALDSVTGLTVAGHYWVDLTELVSHYLFSGARDADPALLGMVPLLHGTIAEMAGYDLAQYVERYPGGCAYPDRDHRCEGAVVKDVLSSWQDGQPDHRPGREV
ncbi:MAG: hypothetical protein WCI74_11590 [Actinomycetes bacterium]